MKFWSSGGVHVDSGGNQVAFVDMASTLSFYFLLPLPGWDVIVNCAYKDFTYAVCTERLWLNINFGSSHDLLGDGGGFSWPKRMKVLPRLVPTICSGVFGELHQKHLLLFDGISVPS